jgi:PAS domain S-box-containing protein
MNPGEPPKAPHILVIEDDKSHQDLSLRAFRNDEARFRVSIAATLRHAREIIGRDPPDLIIADWFLPDGKGIEILPRKDNIVTVPLIIMTSYGDENLAVEIMKSGAIDYVVKSSTTFKGLPHIALRALRDWDNIRQRIQAEETVRDTQKRLADIISFLPDAVLAIDQNGQVIAWNEAIERMTGIAAVEMLGKGDYVYSIPFYGERRPILIDLVQMENNEIEKKYDYIQRDGKRITSETFIPTLFGGKGAYLWGTASPLYDRAGNPVGAIEVIRDITDRKKTELTLQESEIRFRDLFNNMSSGVAIYEPVDNGKDFLIRDINRAVETIEHVGKDEVVGRSILEVFPGVREFGLFSVIQRVAKSGIAESHPVSMYTDNRISGWRENYVYKIPSGDVVAIYEDVTAKKQAEESLRAAHELLGIALRAARAGTWDWDIPRGRRTLSPEFLALFGLSLNAEPSFETWLATLHPDDREMAVAKTNKAVRDHTALWNEYRILLPDGQVRWIGEAGSTTYNDAGEPVRMSGVCIDITDRKKTEETLRESEEKYRTLAENVHDGIYIYDGSAHLVFVNSRAADISGYSQEELLSMDLLNLVHPDDHAYIRDIIGQRFKGLPAPEMYELRLVRKDGIIRTLEISVSPITYLGKFATLGAARDITDRKRAEEELRDLFTYNRGLIEASIDPFVMISRDGKIQDVNTATEKATGFRRGELIGTDFSEYFTEPERAREGYRRVFTEGQVIDYPLEIQHRNGNITPVLYNATVYHDRDGNIKGVFAAARDITERKQAETTRKAYEARLESAMEIGSLAWWEMDLPEGTVRFDDRKATMLGYPPEKFRHYSDFTTLLHAEDYEPAMQAMKDHLEGRETRYNTDYRIMTAAGDYRWFRDVGGITRRHADGTPATVTGIVIDITASRQAEDALRTTEARFRALIQNSSDIIRILDGDGLIVYESPSAGRILGYPPGTMIGRAPLDFIHPDDLECVRKDLQEVFERKNPGIPTEFRIQKADGAYIWVDSIGTNLLDVPGVNGIVVTTRPIDERKRAEEELRSSEQRNRMLLENTGTGIIIIDRDGRYQYANKQAAEVMGVSPEEMIGKSMMDLLPEETARKYLEENLRVIDSGTGREYEATFRLKTGTRSFLIVDQCMKNAQGVGVALQSSSIEITDRKLMEEEIRSLNRVLEQRVKDRTEALSQANKALEEENAQRMEAEKKLQASYDEKVMLLKEIHHRVKNNLQIIASLLNLQSRYITDEQTLAAIRESQNRVKAMALVHEKLYKADNIARISLRDYINFLGSGLFQFYDAKSRGIVFRADIPEIEVDIDSAIPLGLITNELISNSLKYAFPDGRTGEVFISVRKEGSTLTVVFRDTGIGIPPDIDWQDTQSLGLRLVNTLVDQMNGTIELDRSAGTQFTMIVHEKESRGLK